VTAGLVGLAPALGAPPTPKAAAAVAVPSLTPPHPVRNTNLAIQPVFSQTLVGGFAQAGNALLDCSTLSNGNPIPTTPAPGGCVRNVLQALGQGPGFGNRPTYNNQVVQRYLNAPDTNTPPVPPGVGGVPGTFTPTNSSAATVSVPTNARVVFAELSWLGSTQLSGNNPPPGFPPSTTIVTGWDPNIWMEPMDVSIGDNTHFVSVEPDQGTSVTAGVTPGDTNDYYYSSSADITSLMAGRTGQITVWGANAAFPAPFFNMAGLGWNITVVYQYPSVNLGTTPPQVAKQITVQEGFIYQNAGAPATNTLVNVPAVTDPSQIEIGLIAGEGDVGLTGDTFRVCGGPSCSPVNITHPYTGQTNNFFVSYAQGATSPNWTSNFSTDNVSWLLASGIVPAGATSVTLQTTTNGDGYFLTGLNTAIPVPAVCLAKSVDKNPYTDVGETLTYTLTVTNCSGAPIDRVTVSDPLFVSPPLPANCQHPTTLAAGASYTCNPTYIVTVGNIAAGRIVNTARADAFVPGTTIPVAPATATATTETSTNLVITKVGAPKPVHVGDPFTYTITVTNVGPADAANVTVTDPLPAALAGPTVTSGNATITGGVLSATIPLLRHVAPSNTFTITVTGTIETTGTTIVNTATVTAPNTNCPPSSQDPNCNDTDTTQVLQPAPITITKTASTSTPKPGETFTYIVQVRNLSTTTIAMATINDLFPPELINPSWTCAATPASDSVPASSCATPVGDGKGAGVGDGHRVGDGFARQRRRSIRCLGLGDVQQGRVRGGGHRDVI
jgi:uncharacterized repeat protein (TIGR01451 family)